MAMQLFIPTLIRVFVLIITLLGTGGVVLAQATAPSTVPEQAKPFKPEELDALAAPVALYPDPLLAQVMMAATYPLEIVQADRWVKANKDLKGDALTTALEKNTWDPSVKSLVNFPQVLDMMSTQLDWTTKFGDAVIANQKAVMDAVQRLRAKAQSEGNLKTTAEQKVSVEPGPPPLVVGGVSEPQVQVIAIEPTNPQVIYVPTYNPTVVYGTWPYPTYPPPPPYYPPGYVAGSNLVSFGAGLAVGAAWGYAWGHCDWGHNNVDVNVNRNANINNNINRSQYQGNMQNRTNNNFQHDPAHRKGVSYRDQATAQRLDRTDSANAAKARESYRGRTDAGRQDISRGNVSGTPGGNRPNASPGGSAGVNRPNGTPGGSPGVNRPTQTPARSPSSSNALSGMDRGGSAAQASSNRGQASRSAAPAPRSAPRAAPSGGGGSRGGGGGGRGGGGRR